MNIAVNDTAIEVWLEPGHGILYRLPQADALPIVIDERELNAAQREIANRPVQPELIARGSSTVLRVQGDELLHRPHKH